MFLCTYLFIYFYADVKALTFFLLLSFFCCCPRNIRFFLLLTYYYEENPDMLYLVSFVLKKKKKLFYFDSSSANVAHWDPICLEPKHTITWLIHPALGLSQSVMLEHIQMCKAIKCSFAQQMRDTCSLIKDCYASMSFNKEHSSGVDQVLISVNTPGIVNMKMFLNYFFFFSKAQAQLSPEDKLRLGF